MEFKLHTVNGTTVAELTDRDYLVRTSSDFLDLMAESPAAKIAIRKENLVEEFFDLKTGLAGEIMQKISNYGLHMGIIGDFTRYKSKSFRDFVYECNKTGQVVFVATLEEVIKAFCR